jgi:peptide/nickel transport system substrate-binding protein
MPEISPDRRTYTFHIRDDCAFSPPASGVVTAQSMKWTFERTLSPAMASPAQAFFGNIVGATAYINGQANEISGITADGDTLTIHLIEPQGHFLTLIAMPFMCAVPTTLPRSSSSVPFLRPGPTTSRSSR